MLIELSLDLDFPSPDSIGFVPVDFGAVNLPVLHLNGSNSLSLAPASEAVRLDQPSEIPDSMAYGNGLYLGDWTEELFELHEPRGEDIIMRAPGAIKWTK